MARLNISVPDPVYERLDRLRDRLNASRVCTAALEQELDRIEGRPAAPAAQKLGHIVDRIVDRLEGKRDEWYRRGREDGQVWAAEVASLKELHRVGEEWTDDGNYDRERRDLPPSFQLWALVYKWELQDIWEPRAWEWLRAHLAERLAVPVEQVRLGTEEGRYFMLKELGYRDADADAAVRAFERDQGQREDAYLGPEGWAALINAYLEKADLGEVEVGTSPPPINWPPVDAGAFRVAHAEFERRWLKPAYLRGWHHAVREIWREAKPRLQWSPGEAEEASEAGESTGSGEHGGVTTAGAG